MENKKEVYIGIDVSKDFIDIVDGESHHKIVNNMKEIVQFLRKYKQQKVYVCAEFTGPYHRPLVEACHKTKITLFLCDAFKVSYAKKAIGCRSKSDKEDAEFLRLYAMKNELKPYVIPESFHRLKELMNRQDLKTGYVRSLKNLRDSITTLDERKNLEKDIQRTTKEIADIQKKINALIDADKEFREKKTILCSVYGIGEKIATTLLILLPELGHISRTQIAALCGLAPFNNESGKYKGHRCIKGGRFRVREALYMAALSAKKSSYYRPAYDRMIKKDKRPKKVAIIMIARKLVCYLNSLMRKVG